ncbi:Glycosyltransferase involved in cell wall bisynthesis [Verrucomicrobium sp. GAS474]|uniref:glycosyltransferase n=1 Tax=Verrucomicrobium sp. GAS474 TaxID=1882831 RepID=UPI00087B5866|nr:glycosyltransferase [Verrucomicrobium sp. GAS474]SDT86092.1 Glycosyltransferase involved in cell wall bisynthesis [Verrucomicrobium sp. GAS474]
MKILRVIESVDPATGGPAEGVRQITPYLTRAGCRTTVLCFDAPDAAFPLIGEETVRLGGGFRLGPFRPALARWLRSEIGRFDCVIVHGLWQSASTVAAAADRAGVPFFVFPHGMLDPWFRKAYPLKHWKKQLYWTAFEHRALLRARAVLFTAATELALARETFHPWDLQSRARIVPYGIRPPASAAAHTDIDTEADPEAGARRLAARFPELEGKALLLFLARLHRKKGWDLALSALERMIGEGMGDVGGRPIHLLLAGPDEGGERTRIAAHLADLPEAVRRRVTLSGPLYGAEKQGALALADAFFLPSHQENFGIAVVEALAAGVPALISNRVNIDREIVADHAGFAEPDTAKGAFRLLSRWRTAGGTDAAFRERARACFEARFNLERNAPLFLEALRRLGVGTVAEQ